MPASRYRRVLVIRAPLVMRGPRGNRPASIMRVGLGAVLGPPVLGSISSPFGPRTAPTAGASSDHKGIDYAVPVGTPVQAAGAGVVSFAGQQGGFGNVIYIDHGDGTTSIYGHLSQIGVAPGQSVNAGQVIGASGATGTVTGPHLHFEVRVNGSSVDPASEYGSPDAGAIASDAGGSWLDFLSPATSPAAPEAVASSGGLDPIAAGVGAAIAGLALYALV